MFPQISAHKDAEAVFVDDAFIKHFSKRVLRNVTTFDLLFCLDSLVLSCLFGVEVLDLLLLGQRVLEVKHLNFEEGDNRLGRLTLAQVKENLENQEESFYLQESLDGVKVLENEVQVSETGAELLRLVAQGRTVVKENRVEVGAVRQRLRGCRDIEGSRGVHFYRVLEDLCGAKRLRLTRSFDPRRDSRRLTWRQQRLRIVAQNDLRAVSRDFADRSRL